MSRVTEKQLEALVAQINKITGSPATPWTRLAEGRLRANVGNYHISGAYGGVCLHRMMNESGGVITPLGLGHVPKRELYDQLRAFLVGLELSQE